MLTHDNGDSTTTMNGRSFTHRMAHENEHIVGNLRFEWVFFPTSGVGTWCFHPGVPFPGCSWRHLCDLMLTRRGTGNPNGQGKSDRWGGVPEI